MNDDCLMNDDNNETQQLTASSQWLRGLNCDGAVEINFGFRPGLHSPTVSICLSDLLHEADETPVVC